MSILSSTHSGIYASKKITEALLFQFGYQKESTWYRKVIDNVGHLVYGRQNEDGTLHFFVNYTPMNDYEDYTHTDEDSFFSVKEKDITNWSYDDFKLYDDYNICARKIRKQILALEEAQDDFIPSYDSDEEEMRHTASIIHEISKLRYTLNNHYMELYEKLFKTK